MEGSEENSNLVDILNGKRSSREELISLGLQPEDANRNTATYTFGGRKFLFEIKGNPCTYELIRTYPHF